MKPAMPKSKKIKTLYKFPWANKSIIQSICAHPDSTMISMTDQQSQRGKQANIYIGLDGESHNGMVNVCLIASHAIINKTIPCANLRVRGDYCQNRIAFFRGKSPDNLFRFPLNRLGFVACHNDNFTPPGHRPLDEDKYFFEFLNEDNFTLQIVENKNESVGNRTLIIGIKINGEQWADDVDRSPCIWALHT